MPCSRPFLLVLEDPDQVQRAVALVESLIQREDQGSLGWWICQEVFHLSTHFDVHFDTSYITGPGNLAQVQALW